MLRIPILLLIITALSSCAGTSSSYNTPSDPANWIRPGELSDHWVPDRDIVARGNPPTHLMVEPGASGLVLMCAVVGFHIDEDGRTRSHRLLSVDPVGSWSVDTPIRTWSRPAVDAAKQLRYLPADGEPLGEPVFTYRAFAYKQLTDGGDRDRYLDPFEDWCEARLEEGVVGPAVYAAYTSDEKSLQLRPQRLTAGRNPVEWWGQLALVPIQELGL